MSLSRQGTNKPNVPFIRTQLWHYVNTHIVGLKDCKESILYTYTKEKSVFQKTTSTTQNIYTDYSLIISELTQHGKETHIIQIRLDYYLPLRSQTEKCKKQNTKNPQQKTYSTLKKTHRTYFWVYLGPFKLNLFQIILLWTTIYIFPTMSYVKFENTDEEKENTI